VTPPIPNTAGPGQGGNRAYKRSWKNLLINKRYQLQFTLFMVGLSTLLMSGLGIWVMRVANETTTVSMASVRGTPCPKVPALTEAADAAAEDEELPAIPMKLPDDGVPPAAAGAGSDAADKPPEPAASAAAGSGAGSGSGDDAAPRRVKVQLDESSMTMMTPTAPKLPPDFGVKVIGHWTCELRLATKLDDLERGRMLILWVLIGTGLLLVGGLAVYGIKMTHKVAGPLFKVSLYLAKMRNGRFDKVWNLRKGDQLVDFYDHFKTAHAGVVQMEKDDITRLEEVIAAAEAAGAGDHATVVELREILQRKEKAIE
jgi:hypothetical protein